MWMLERLLLLDTTIPARRRANMDPAIIVMNALLRRRWSSRPSTWSSSSVSMQPSPSISEPEDESQLLRPNGHLSDASMTPSPSSSQSSVASSHPSLSKSLEVVSLKGQSSYSSAIPSPSSSRSSESAQPSPSWSSSGVETHVDVGSSSQLSKLVSMPSLSRSMSSVLSSHPSPSLSKLSTQ